MPSFNIDQMADEESGENAIEGKALGGDYGTDWHVSV
jgi:hypothetical protein